MFHTCVVKKKSRFQDIKDFKFYCLWSLSEYYVQLHNSWLTLTLPPHDRGHYIQRYSGLTTITTPWLAKPASEREKN